ncbi:hypothetical protein RCL_jg5994.t2 [Rhizophagus clarus]|uniref:Uncharacterized protein n=1 Tax=Rhizophagus clarus TaxID=94130 RepID=A0A8H3M0P3_9GLOM|nr:hypothetical protein RCL_jg5994.t2 [Rhizophagus clarus]
MNEHKFPYPLKCIRTFVKKKWMCILAIRINVLWIDLTAKESFEHEILFKLSFPKLLALFIYKKVSSPNKILYGEHMIILRQHPRNKNMCLRMAFIFL